jgi:hypothetical protein
VLHYATRAPRALWPGLAACLSSSIGRSQVRLARRLAYPFTRLCLLGLLLGSCCGAVPRRVVVLFSNGYAIDGSRNLLAEWPAGLQLVLAKSGRRPMADLDKGARHG